MGIFYRAREGVRLACIVERTRALNDFAGAIGANFRAIYAQIRRGSRVCRDDRCMQAVQGTCIFENGLCGYGRDRKIRRIESF